MPKSIAQMKKSKQVNFPEYIIVHHTGGTDENPLEDTSHHTFSTIQNWHIHGRGWENIGYHWVIEKDGKLTAGRPEHYHGAHCRGYNKKSVGVVLTGNFDATMPTKKQEETLTTLLQRIMERHAIPVHKIVPHRKFANKSCFGNNLADDWAQNLVVKKAGTCLDNYTGLELILSGFKKLGL